MATIKVKGVTCGGCANSVKRAIAAVATGLQIEVDIAAQEVHVPEGRIKP